MSDKPDLPGEEGTGLNPALKSRVDTTHDTTGRSPAPVDSASVQREEGRSWPVIWLVVTVVCVLIVIYLVA